MKYATLCAIAKNEDTVLPEWTEYHLRIGFEHIYLFDNGSDIPARELLREYGENGLVTVIDFPLTERRQLSAYAAALKEFGTGTVWTAFLDLDEFLVPKEHDDIRDLLDDYSEFGALGAHWKMFGSGGLVGKPEGGLIQNYTTVVGDDKHIKTILRPARTMGPCSPHHFTYKSGYYCVNEDRVPVTTFNSYHISRRIQVNHYYYKSLEEFSAKLERGRAAARQAGAVSRRKEEEFARFEEQATSEGYQDDTIIRLMNRLREKGPDSIPGLSAELRDGGVGGLPEALQRISKCIAGNRMDLARNTLNALLRYHDVPPVWVAAAKVYLAAGVRKKAFEYIVKLLRDPESPFLAEGYQCLAAWYAKYGEAEKARRILDELY